MNGGELHRLARVLRELAQLATRDPGERSPGAGTLAVVEDVHAHPDTRIKDIVQRTGLAQSQVSRTVDQLRLAGVLQLGKDPADGRSTLVRLDATTRQDFVHRGARSISDALKQALPDLTEGRRRRIEAALEVLAAELLDRPVPPSTTTQGATQARRGLVTPDP